MQAWRITKGLVIRYLGHQRKAFLGYLDETIPMRTLCENEMHIEPEDLPGPPYYY